MTNCKKVNFLSNVLDLKDFHSDHIRFIIDMFGYLFDTYSSNNTNQRPLPTEVNDIEDIPPYNLSIFEMFDGLVQLSNSTSLT